MFEFDNFDSPYYSLLDCWRESLPLFLLFGSSFLVILGHYSTTHRIPKVLIRPQFGLSHGQLRLDRTLGTAPKMLGTTTCLKMAQSFFGSVPVLQTQIPLKPLRIAQFGLQCIKKLKHADHSHAIVIRSQSTQKGLFMSVKFPLSQHIFRKHVRLRTCGLA